jgi:hypothetical protein
MARLQAGQNCEAAHGVPTHCDALHEAPLPTHASGPTDEPAGQEEPAAHIESVGCEEPGGQ